MSRCTRPRPPQPEGAESWHHSSVRWVIVPRWSGTSESDFYPWLRGELADDGVEFGCAELWPAPGAPTIVESVRSVNETLAEAPPDTAVTAHSVGCQALLRALAEPGPPLLATVLVAPWLTLDDPWDAIRPWVETEPSLEAARPRLGRVHALLSDDDPFTSDYERTLAALRDRVGARVRVVPGARHFNEPREADVLVECRAALA